MATTLAFTPDSTRLATASGGTAQVWDMTGSEVARLERSEDIRAMIFRSDGNFLTTIGGTTARLWDVNEDEVTWTGGCRPRWPSGLQAGRQPIRYRQRHHGSSVGSCRSRNGDAAHSGQRRGHCVQPGWDPAVTVSGTIAQVWAV